MNKYVLILILIVLLVGGGFVYRSLTFDESTQVLETGVTREFTVTVYQETWAYNPDLIEIEAGDRIKLHVINRDEFDHGFAIDAYGISQRLPASGSINVEFVAIKPGVFPFYCSVSCGSGVVDGVERGHFDHLGNLLVHRHDDSHEHDEDEE